MYRRRVQKTGGSTFIISLPKEWVKRMKLQPGQVMEIHELEDLSLLLSPPSKPRKDEARIRVMPSENPEAVGRKIVALYLTGFNTITVSSEERLSSEVKEYLKNLIRTRLAGTEIIEDLPNSLTSRILLSPKELPVKDAVKRMWVVAESMINDALLSLESPSLSREVEERDNEVDRFGIYTVRLLKSVGEGREKMSEIGLKSIRECLGYRLITKSIERVADHAVLIARSSAEVSGKIPPGLRQKLKELGDLSLSSFRKSLEALERQDYDLAESVIQKGEEVDSLLTPALKAILKRPPEETAPLRIIFESLKRITEYSADIAEIVLNLSILKD